MSTILRYSVFGAVIATTLAAAGISALAANPYDGTWHVNITTTAGTCGSGVGFDLQVRNGIVLWVWRLPRQRPGHAARRRARRDHVGPVGSDRQRRAARQFRGRLVAWHRLAGTLQRLLER